MGIIRSLSSSTYSARNIMYVLLGVLAAIHCWQLFSTTYTIDHPNDFRTPWLSTRILLQGENPYPDLALAEEWQEVMKDYPSDTSSNPPGYPQSTMQYPPWSFPPLSLLSWAPWEQIRWCWYFINIILLLGICRIVSLLSRQHLTEHQPTWKFLLIALAFKGIVPALLHGQLLFLSLFAGLLSLYYAESRQSWKGAFWLFISAIKINVAFPFFILMIVRKQYDSLLKSLVLIALASGFTLYFFPQPLVLFESWVKGVMSVQHYFLANPKQTILLHNTTTWASIPAYWGWINGTLVLSILSVIFLLIGLLICIFSLAFRRSDPLLQLAILAGLAFINMYHLFYDLLIFIILVPVFTRLPLKSQLLIGFCSMFLFLPINGLIVWLPTQLQDVLRLHMPIVCLGFLWALWPAWKTPAAEAKP